jgi:protein-L-isoaspartate O-methyltransferase
MTLTLALIMESKSLSLSKMGIVRQFEFDGFEERKLKVSSCVKFHLNAIERVFCFQNKKKMSASRPTWDWRDRTLTREQAEDQLHLQEKRRNRETETKMEKKRPSFCVRTTKHGLGLSTCRNGSVLHAAIVETPQGWFELNGSRGLSIEDLLVNIGFIDKPAPATASGSRTEKVAAVAGAVGSGLTKVSEASKQVAGVLDSSSAAENAAGIAGAVSSGIAKLANVNERAANMLAGASDLVNAIAVASPILRAVVDVVAAVARMHVQVQVNKRKAAVLIDLVKSFRVPLDEIEQLLAAQTLDTAFVVHLQKRLSEVQSSLDGAQAVLRVWCAQAGRSLLKKIKQHLAAGDIDKAFDEAKDDVRQNHQLLCNDLSIKVATKVLGESGKAADKALARAGDACKDDLKNLERDLTAAFDAVGKSLGDELNLVNWSISGLHDSVAEMSHKQDKMIALQEKSLAQQEQLQADMKHLVEQLKQSKEAPAKIVFQYEPAAAFWRDVIVPKLATAGELPWSLFASAIFCELLEPAGVQAADWRSIKADIKFIFDRDDDDIISVYEYNAVTFSNRQTLLEICKSLLAKAGKRGSERKLDELVEDALLQPIRYPPLAKEERIMVQAVFDGRDEQDAQDETLLFAMSSVPRAWFAIDERGVSSPLAQVCDPDRHWIAGALRMPSASLCADLLRWLGWGGGGAGDNASFLHVACGNAYINAVVAVVQQWAHRNVAVAEGNDSALASAAARVASFAKAAGVVATGVQPLPTLATVGGEQFDRVLVSLLCPSIEYVRARFSLLVEPVGGRLVAPVQLDEDVAFICVGSDEADDEVLCIWSGREVAALCRLFPAAPDFNSEEYQVFDNNSE